jgi:hypothetical protein
VLTEHRGALCEVQERGLANMPVGVNAGSADKACLTYVKFVSGAWGAACAGSFFAASTVVRLLLKRLALASVRPPARVRLNGPETDSRRGQGLSIRAPPSL